MQRLFVWHRGDKWRILLWKTVSTPIRGQFKCKLHDCRGGASKTRKSEQAAPLSLLQTSDNFVCKCRQPWQSRGNRSRVILRVNLPEIFHSQITMHRQAHAQKTITHELMRLPSDRCHWLCNRQERLQHLPQDMVWAKLYCSMLCCCASHVRHISTIASHLASGTLKCLPERPLIYFFSPHRSHYSKLKKIYYVVVVLFVLW